MKKLVFDVDGVLVDVLSPVEEYIHGYARRFQETRDTQCDFDLLKLAPCEIENLASFRMCDCHEYDFAPFPSYLTKRIKQSFSMLPSIYGEPLAMQDMSLHYGNASNLYSCGYSDVHYESVTTNTASFFQWQSLIEFLLGYFDVEFHTQTFTQESGEARLNWLERTFVFDDTAGDVIFSVDVGKKKSVMQGDIVVEDCLSNLFTAETSYRVLHGTFYNTANRGNNLETWRKAGSPDIKVYGTFAELCDCLFRLIAELHNIELYLVKRAWWSFINELKEIEA